jgi:hypothetical protein
MACGIAERYPQAAEGAEGDVQGHGERERDVVSGEIADGQAEQGQGEHAGPHGGQYGQLLSRAELHVMADHRGEGHERRGREGGGQRGDELAGQCRCRAERGDGSCRVQPMARWWAIRGPVAEKTAHMAP